MATTESLVLCAAIAVTSRSADSRTLCVDFDAIHYDGLITVPLAREATAAHECWLPAVPLAGFRKVLCTSGARQHALMDAVFSSRCAAAAHCVAVCEHVDESASALEWSAATLAALPGLAEVAAHTAIISTTLGGTLTIRIDGLPPRVARTCGIELRRQRWAGALLLAWVHVQVWKLLAGAGVGVGAGAGSDSGSDTSCASRPGVGIVMATKIVDYGVVDSVSPTCPRPVSVCEAQLHHTVHVSVFECPTLPSAPDGISIAQKLTDVMATMRREHVWSGDDAASFLLQCCGQRGGTVDLALAFAAERNEERCIAAFPQLVTASGGIASTILSARFGKTTFSSADAGWRIAALPSSCSRNSSFFFLFSHSMEMIAHGTELIARCVPLLSCARHKIHAVACATIAPLCVSAAAAGSGAGSSARAGAGAGADADADEMDEDAALRDFFAQTKTGFSLFDVREALRNKQTQKT
jgi:hypothetical protein